MAHRLNRRQTVKLADRDIHLSDPARRYLVTAADGTTAEGMITGITSELGRTDVTLGEFEHRLNYVTEIWEVGAPVTEFRPPAEPADPETEVYLYAPDGAITGPIIRGDDGKWAPGDFPDHGASWGEVLTMACTSGATIRWSTPLAPEND